MRKRSVLEKIKIIFSKFPMALKLFELKISVLKAFRELRLNNTAYKKLGNCLKSFTFGKIALEEL